VLVEDGIISEEELARFYVRGCGIPYLQLSDYKIPQDALGALPREAAVSAGVLPIEKSDDRITVATARPADSRLVEEVVQRTGCHVRTVLAMRDQLLEALGRAYSGEPGEEKEARDDSPPRHEEEAVSSPDESSKQKEAMPQEVEFEWLLHAAKAMAKNAYAPHSNLHVGAAVLADNGEVFAGCNIENDSYSLSICAERVAIFRAVCAGRREIRALAVVSDRIKGIRPCGACLQVIKQFGPEAYLVFESAEGGVEIISINELLPQAFSLERGAE
jgi:cytidine deaminase